MPLDNGVDGENFIARRLPRKAINVVSERYISNGKRLPKGQRAYTVDYVSAGGFNSMVVVTFVVNGVKTETYKLQ